jgi:hypothetical protein
MTDRELDRLLSAWFDEGAPTAPYRIAEGAMAQVATVPQERDWPNVLRTSFASAPLAWAAGFLALAIGLGILMGTRLVGGPTPSPDPSPEPSASSVAAPAQTGLDLYVNPEAGFEVLVPRGWEEMQPQSFAGRHPGMAAFGHPWDETSLMTISAGTADGAFSLCVFTCEQVVADSLDELQEALAISETVQSWNGSEFEEVPVAFTVEDVMLGGVQGRMVRYDPEREGVAPTSNYAFAFVDGRPVVFSIAPLRPWGMVGLPNTEVLDRDQLEAILGSFRFLDGQAEADEEAGSEPSTYIHPTGLYSVDLPPGSEVISEDDREVRLRVSFVQGAFSPVPATAVLVIRAGTEDGRIWMCARTRCDDVKPKNTYDLARLLVGDERRVECTLYRPCTTTRWTSLGGENAILVLQRSSTSLLVVREGRPFWLLWQDPLPNGLLNSFRFLDGQAEAEYAWESQLIRSDSAGFEIRVPISWRLDDQGDVVRLNGDGNSLTLRVGTAGGRIVTCDSPDRPWERCRDRIVTSLDELREAVAVGPPPGCDWCIPGGWLGLDRESTLDGEEAWRIAFYGYEYPARGSETALYVLALHDGRPYFLRFHTSAEGSQDSRRALWSEILETFTFLP